MANNYWQDVSADWAAGANWSTGAAPVAADHVYILEGSQTIITNLPGAAAGVNYQSLTVGEQFKGAIGNSANKLYLGTLVGDIQYSGHSCKECWLIADAGDACSINVEATQTGTNALHLFSGTWTNVRVRRAGLVRIGTGATVTNLYSTYFDTAASDAHIIVESGATLTTAYQTAGIVDCEAALTTLHQGGGVWNHQGATVFNITTLNTWAKAIFNFHSAGGTITTWNGYGGKVDCNGGPGKVRTITTVNRFPGSELNLLGMGASVTVTNDNKYGGLMYEGS